MALCSVYFVIIWLVGRSLNIKSNLGPYQSSDSSLRHFQKGNRGHSTVNRQVSMPALLPCSHKYAHTCHGPMSAEIHVCAQAQIPTLAHTGPESEGASLWLESIRAQQFHSSQLYVAPGSLPATCKPSCPHLKKNYYLLSFCTHARFDILKIPSLGMEL